MRALLPYAVDDPDLWEVYQPPDGPWIRANMVASADGAATADGRAQGLSNDTDRHLFRMLRAMSDVVLVAAGTVRDEKYGPVKLPAEMTARRTAAGRSEQPTLAIVSGSLQLDWGSRLFTESTTRPLVITSSAADPTRRAQAEEVADVVIAGEEKVETGEVRRALVERGLPRILTEGGPSFLGQLVADGGLDELCLAISPRLAGAGAPRIVTGPAAALTEMTVVSVLEDDGFLYVRYVRADRATS
ncbi:MAG TPA: pyrimidine reductase family protein [Mycobacteriales bacterium]|nr:pyrimidine reductase family protein [Mycobacteriales bacterium]